MVKGLEPMEVHEKEPVTFEVELTHDNVEATWMKDGVRLKPKDNCLISVRGKKHSLTLSSLAIEDSGLVAFKAEGIHITGRLNVKGKQYPAFRDLVGIMGTCVEASSWWDGRTERGSVPSMPGCC